MLGVLGTGCVRAPVHPAIEPAERTVRWRGHRWQMRKPGPPTGAGPTSWSDAPEAVAVHADQLCLALTRDDQGPWRGAEVWRPVRRRRRVRVRLAPLPDDPAIVVGVFLYRDDTDELDVEWSRWGEREAPPLQLAVAPRPDAPGRRVRLDLPAPEEVTIHSRRAGPVFRVHSGGQRFTWQLDDPLPGRGPWNLHVNIWPLPGAVPAGAAQVCLRE